MQTVSSHLARRRLSALLARVSYTNTQIQIERYNPPMAWLVSAPFIEKMNQLLDHIRQQLKRRPARRH